jgi:CBS domain containing-hemolysin-like protein
VARLLERALAFADLTASEVATPQRRVVGIDLGATCADLRDLVRSGHSRFPVLDDGELIGMVHVKALLRVAREDWPTTPVADVMFEPILVPETARLPDVLSSLRTGRSEIASVLDEHGTFVGIVTAEDIAEELVGDIVDESDQHLESVRQVREGYWSIPGALRVDELARETGVVLPQGDYDTVAGLILTRLGRIAVQGDSVDVEGVRLTVDAVDGRAIAAVSIEVDGSDNDQSERES